MVQIAGKNLVHVERIHDERRAYKAARRPAVFRQKNAPWRDEPDFRREAACWEAAQGWDGQIKSVPIMSLTTAIKPRFSKMNKERLIRWAKRFEGYDLDDISVELNIARVDMDWTRQQLVALCTDIWEATVVVRASAGVKS